MNDPIVVTGLGLITPLGCGVDENWRRVSRGETLMDLALSDDLPQDLARVSRVSPYVNPNGHHRIFPMARSAAAEALAMAGLQHLDERFAGRIGCSISISKPIVQFSIQGSRGQGAVAQGGSANPRSNFSAVDFMEEYLPDAVGRYVMRGLGVSGPCMNLIAACATGVHSIQAASRWLMEGQCDAALCGSAESSLNPLIVSGFNQLGVLSDFPRPFDRKRDGFMMGEGAGVLLLERKSDALARGAEILAELCATELGTDVNHPTAFSEEGRAIDSVLRRALAKAGMAARGIGYLNAHGTGTVKNDRIEAQVLGRVFGKEAPDLSISSTKASTGHLLGASASVEAALACLALRHQFIPPTANLEDPESDLDYTPRAGKEKRFNYAMSVSFGFGGPIGAVIFKRNGA